MAMAMAMEETINMDRIGVSFDAHIVDTLKKHNPLAVIVLLDESLIHV
jgi:hypothetical protein